MLWFVLYYRFMVFVLETALSPYQRHEVYHHIADANAVLLMLYNYLYHPPSKVLCECHIISFALHR